MKDYGKEAFKKVDDVEEKLGDLTSTKGNVAIRNLRLNKTITNITTFVLSKINLKTNGETVLSVKLLCSGTTSNLGVATLRLYVNTKAILTKSFAYNSSSTIVELAEVIQGAGEKEVKMYFSILNPSAPVSISTAQIQAFGSKAEFYD